MNHEALRWVGRAGLAVQGTRQAARETSRPATMVLAAWRRSWLAYSFDRCGGRFSRRLVRLGECPPISGFGTVEKTIEHGRMFFCLYRWGGRMWFQAGERTWCLASDSTDLRLSYRLLPGRRGSEFVVTENARISFRCSYPHPFGGLFTRAAPAGDTVDYEGEHFLAHVAGHTLPLADSDAWHDGKTSEDDDSAEDVRQGIRDHLQRLTQLGRQSDQGADNPDTDTPADLFYSWIESSYRPTSAAFQQAFALPERERLKQFTAVLQTASWGIDDEIESEVPPAAPIWTRVLRDAEQILQDLPATLPARH